MKELELFETHVVQLLKHWGVEHPFFSLNMTTLINTWVVMLIITGLCLLGRASLRRPQSKAGFIAKYIGRTFYDLVTQNLGFANYHHTLFITTLFVFIFVANMTVLLPVFEKEPTTDLNTTFALGIIAFGYIQWQSIKAHGLWSYIKEYLSPFFIFLPVNILGELATIVSLSFRLFGNIFGGSVIGGIWHNTLSGSLTAHLVGIFSGINMVLALFFGVFEGTIQAFVFTMLTLTYLSLALAPEEN